jgi:hypothetical protein
MENWLLMVEKGKRPARSSSLVEKNGIDLCCKSLPITQPDVIKAEKSLRFRGASLFLNVDLWKPDIRKSVWLLHIRCNFYTRSSVICG